MSIIQIVTTNLWIHQPKSWLWLSPKLALTGQEKQAWSRPYGLSFSPNLSAVTSIRFWMGQKNQRLTVANGAKYGEASKKGWFRGTLPFRLSRMRCGSCAHQRAREGAFPPWQQLWRTWFWTMIWSWSRASNHFGCIRIQPLLVPPESIDYRGAFLCRRCMGALEHRKQTHRQERSSLFFLLLHLSCRRPFFPLARKPFWISCLCWALSHHNSKYD